MASSNRQGPEDADLLHALEGDIQRCQDLISGILLGGGRLLGLGLVVIGGGLSIGLAGGHREVLIGVPLALLMFLVYWLRMQIEMLSQGGYKRRLEERVNAVLGVSIMSWERRIAPAIGHHVLTNRLIDALFMIVLAISWGAAYWAVVIGEFSRRWRVGLYWGLSSFFVVSVVFLVIGYRDAFGAHGRAYEIARAAESDDPAPP